MMSTRSGLRPGTSRRCLGVILREAVDEVPHVGPRRAAARGRQPRQAAAGHDHAGEVGERAAGADELVERRGGLVGRLAQLAVDEPHHADDVVVRHRLRASSNFSASRTAPSLRGVDRLDQLARGERRSRCCRRRCRPAACSCRRGRSGGGRFGTRSRASWSESMISIGRSSSCRTRRQNSRPLVASRTAQVAMARIVSTPMPATIDLKRRSAASEACDRLLVELAGGGERPGEPGRLALFVEHAVAAAGLGLGDDQADAVAADVDRGQPRVDVGREVGLLVGHARRAIPCRDSGS